MSLNPQPIPEVPTETYRIAHAAFPKGTLCMTIRDQIGIVYRDEQFQDLFANRGQPAQSPWQLALVCILQFVENLSDRQAANAVRARIDWKYLLGLELEDSGFHYSVLSEFRQRLLEGGLEHLLLDTLLEHLKEQRLLKTRGKQRTDSTLVLAAIWALNRLECVGETMRHILNVLAVVAPEWLLNHHQPAWVDRYGPRVDDYRLPEGKQDRITYAEVIGTDGQYLLTALDAPDTPDWLRQLPAVVILRQVWEQNYHFTEKQLRWRSSKEIPPSSEYINSPYDPEARYSQKHTKTWVGYKVHLTETCEPDSPHLITHVETTNATLADDETLTPIHDDLETKTLLPATHLVDAGYVTALRLVESQEQYHVDLYGPARANYHWQAREATGFSVQDFSVDWELQQATCPAGQTSRSWTPALDNRGRDVIKIKFSAKDCRPCPSRPLCTRAKTNRRTLSIRPDKQYQALQAARARHQTEAFVEQYAQRAGVEGTISQGVRAFDLRRSRYLGLAKTHLQHILIATGMNLVRVADWLNERPRAKTHLSPYVKLCRAIAA
ncbi:IS1182 family transposase [Chloroflexota bacterium]